MPDAVSALKGATYQGFATVSDVDPGGMITLRGDLGASKVKKAVKAATGVDTPDVRKANFAGETGVCWMSPDELLILCPYTGAAEMVAKLQKPLASVHHLVVNVSDARAQFSVTGVDAREVMAKLTPADVSPAAFQPGDFRRSRLAQVAGAFWMSDEQTFQVICFRSVGQYVFDLLKTAAIPGGEVGYL